MRSLSILVLFSAFLLVILAAPAAAQRDYFTPEEIELVRDTQKIDDRITLLTKIIDRRFSALNIDVSGAKINPKDLDKWGALPELTRQQLLLDIKRILQKAVDDIDSLADRPDSAVLPDPDAKKTKQSFADVFPKAVRILAAAAQRYQPALKGELDKPNDPSSKGSVLDSMEMCEQIIAAVDKIPSQMEKVKKKN